jgi:hypothetical protein
LRRRDERLLAHAPAKLHVSERGETGGNYKPQDNGPGTPADEALVDGQQREPEGDGEVPPGEEARIHAHRGKQVTRSLQDFSSPLELQEMHIEVQALVNDSREAWRWLTMKVHKQSISGQEQIFSPVGPHSETQTAKSSLRSFADIPGNAAHRCCGHLVQQLANSGLFQPNW